MRLRRILPLLVFALQFATAAPRLIRYDGNLLLLARTGPAIATFSIYSYQHDGAPLWIEVQNIQTNQHGAYSVLLGSTLSEGLPLDIFTTAEPRWLEVEVNGTKQPRVLLASVPYAMVAANAQTLGGLPVSSYLRLDPVATSTSPIGIKPNLNLVSGSAGYLAQFSTNLNDLNNSALFQTGNTLSVGGSTSLGAMTLTGSAPSADTPGMAIYNQGGGAGASVSLDMYNTTFNGGIPQAKIKALDDGNYSDHLTFLTKTPGAINNPATEKVRVTSTGNVGIGTTTPAATLEVAGNMKVNGNLTLSGPGVLSFPDGSALASSPRTGNPNLSAIAQLRWGYTTQTSYTAGPGAVGLVFDGANIWVANAQIGNYPSTITKINVATGASVNYPVSNNGYFGALAFDGANIWIGNPYTGVLIKMKASTGAILNTYNGNFGGPMAFDGANLWIASINGSVTKLRASDGTVLGTYSVSRPGQIVFDGTNIWVLRTGVGYLGDPLRGVTKLLASTGAILGTWYFPFGARALAFDGTNIWIDSSTSQVTKMQASTGAVVGTYNIGIAAPSFAQSMVFDGANIWVACQAYAVITKLQASTGATLGNYSVATYPNAAAGSLAFDGSSIWVSLDNYSLATPGVIKISPSAR